MSQRKSKLINKLAAEMKTTKRAARTKIKAALKTATTKQISGLISIAKTNKKDVKNG